MTIFETNPSFQPRLQNAKSLVKAFNKSCNVTERLTERAGKKLVNDCRTRWDSTFLMIARLLEIKDHVSEVADELLPDTSLLPIQWNHLEIIYFTGALCSSHQYCKC